MIFNRINKIRASVVLCLVLEMLSGLYQEGLPSGRILLYVLANAESVELRDRTWGVEIIRKWTNSMEGDDHIS